MKHLDEYRDKKLVENLVSSIGSELTRSWTIMEICGGQTHGILKYNLPELLPDDIKLVHGPGCPVCVTPMEMIDRAIELATREGVILASFGDMLRVPGSSSDLLSARAAGGNVKIVYSPMDAVKLAREQPENQVVFLAVGFETTAPAVALAVRQAKLGKVKNFSILVAHVLVPPAMKVLLSSPDNQIQGFLAAGHVCTVMGYHEYIPISQEFQVPIAVTGFEPVDILLGIYRVIQMLEQGKIGVINAYERSVTQEGNEAAQALLKEVFQPCDRKWRGIGHIPTSGYELNAAYEEFDASRRFQLTEMETEEPAICIAGEILTGFKKPVDCSAFGTLCKPEKPLGAPMVSSEGACAAYYKYDLSH